MVQQQPQQILLRDVLVPPNKQYDLEEANRKIDLTNPSCPPSSKILGNILRQHLLCFTLIASASVPWICIQQVWHTIKLDDSKDKFKFFIDTKEFTFSVDNFQNVFQLPQATDNNNVGFIMQMLCYFINIAHVDYATLMWEGLHYSYLHPTAVIPYLRFTKIIVDHILTKNPDLPKRIKEHYHKVENEEVIKSIFNYGKNKGLGMRIPEWMLTKEMKQAKHYKLYAVEFGIDVPMTQILRRRHLNPKQPILTTAQIDIASLDEATPMSLATARSIKDFEPQQEIKKVDNYLVDEEIEKIMEGDEESDVNKFVNGILNSQEDLSTRREPESHKKSPNA
ncbi:hypothetical protein Tco_0580857 [Tanacetum coccineum]